MEFYLIQSVAKIHGAGPEVLWESTLIQARILSIRHASMIMGRE